MAFIGGIVFRGGSLDGERLTDDTALRIHDRYSSEPEDGSGPPEVWLFHGEIDDDGLRVFELEGHSSAS